MSRKERKQKKITYFSADVLRADALACGRGRVACGRGCVTCGCGCVTCRRVGVWTWTRCVQMWMSRKERKKKKKITYFNADMLRADALVYGRDVLRADADE